MTCIFTGTILVNKNLEEFQIFFQHIKLEPFLCRLVPNVFQKTSDNELRNEYNYWIQCDYPWTKGAVTKYKDKHQTYSHWLWYFILLYFKYICKHPFKLMESNQNFYLMEPNNEWLIGHFWCIRCFVRVFS